MDEERIIMDEERIIMDEERIIMDEETTIMDEETTKKEKRKVKCGWDMLGILDRIVFVAAVLVGMWIKTSNTVFLVTGGCGVLVIILCIMMHCFCLEKVSGLVRSTRLWVVMIYDIRSLCTLWRTCSVYTYDRQQAPCNETWHKNKTRQHHKSFTACHVTSSK